ILAIMPQYGFYRVPENARRMTFTQLYIDCCRQLQSHDIEIGPLSIESEHPFDSQIGGLRTGLPEPVYLGDLVKLLNRPVQHSPKCSVVNLMTLEKQLWKTRITKAKSYWPMRGLMAQAIMTRTGRVPHGSDQHCVLQAFSTILRKINWSVGSRVNPKNITRTEAIPQLCVVSWETFALLAAILGCSVPLSAYKWAEQHLEVLHLHIFEGRAFMALAPKHIAELTGSWYFLWEVGDYAMGGDGPMPWPSLLAMTDGQDNDMTQCIFPPDITLSDG
ncbi:hypothetical protein C8R45DRAFT_817185, partial [Mycena sanguinolenta]